MGDLNAFIEGMRWWCESGDLGYDQGNRWDVRVGGETDCSALVISIARATGFDTGLATYTGNMRREFCSRGWTAVAPDGNPQPGDILLCDAYHVAVYLGSGLLAQASIDERGEIAGGQSGDQTDYETNVRSYYDYPWDCYLRYGGGHSTAEEWTEPGTRYNPNRYGEAYVRQVQQLLVDRGYDIGPDGVDGILGAKTHFAIMAFQNASGLVVDGIPGPQTMAALKGGSTDVTTAPALQYRDITALQAAVGADPDNVAGPDTRQRILAVASASAWGGVTFPFGVRYTQQIIGTDPDGIWGDDSETHHDAVVARVQAAVGAEIDSIWGEDTNARVMAALAAAEQA